MITLPPIKETTEDYEAIERRIRDLFRREIYVPLMRAFSDKTIRNSKPGLVDALRNGRVTFNRGTFSGKFSSVISHDLRRLGARFNRSDSTYQIAFADLPPDVKAVISATESRFTAKVRTIDSLLAQISPDALAEKLKVENLFDRAIYKVDKDFNRSVKNITVAPELTGHARSRLAREWSENMQLWVKDFTEKEITELRGKIKESTFAGNRYGAAIRAIEDSYGVTARKAKFLARQETMLMMTKLKQTRYQSAGVEFYRWGCVSGTALHPVRPLHKKNKDKVFRWDNPPTVDEQGNHKNPGQDYNCRCFARPLVGFKPKNPTRKLDGSYE